MAKAKRKSKKKFERKASSKSVFRVTLHFALEHGEYHKYPIVTLASDDVEARAKAIEAIRAGATVVFLPRSEEPLRVEHIKFAEVQHITEIDIL